MSIELRHVSKTFGAFRALDDVSLAVRAGELLALLGPSGSGKTTLLRIIAGLDQANPDPRTLIRFHDQDVAATPVRRRRVGFVFQHYSLFRHMSVFENVAFGLKVQPRRIRPSADAIAARVEALLRMVQLDGMAGRYPHQLSGGQRQRVALVRALAVEPRVLLLDEPFGALDARVRKELRSWLRRLHDEIHVTSVFVTHDQDEALEVADRIVVMNAGRIEQVGTPEEVFHHPQTPFVMRFLGETNAFHGRLQGNDVLLGDLAVPCPNPLPGRNGSAEVFVRPHDLVVDAAADGPRGIPATVLRVQAAGPLVRIDLRTDDGHALAAQISQDRFATLQLQPGQAVCVRPRHVLAVSASS